MLPVGAEVDEGDFVLRLAERLPDDRERWEASAKRDAARHRVQSGGPERPRTRRTGALRAWQAGKAKRMDDWR